MAIINTVNRQVSNILASALFKISKVRYKVDPKSQKYVDELKNSLKITSSISNLNTVRSEWNEHLIRLQQYLLSNNPIYFLENKIIRDTMFVGNTFYVLPEYSYLKRNNWNKWKKVIKESDKFPIEHFILNPSTSGNTIHHTYHLARFINDANIDFKKLKVIFEFGGGYGNMCRIIRKLGFNGIYIIFDLPPFAALQTFYLNVNNIQASYNKTSSLDKVKCFSDLAKLTSELKKHNNQSESLFIATWSLSESPLTIRKLIEPLLKNFKYYLISFQSHFNNIDNLKYFKKLQSEHKKHQWHKYEIIQLPNNNYLFGHKK